ncbi:hypothetical protein YSA_06913 [Pseudomonas putida ND6]|uniref:Uncharacterized protein n=1 Tax=Pseudomonas putida ND6 TaxID=231023 RepID=I3UYC4_PSEPU|nr:hypothetical protein YSA_06913 [Pseudomonas putida ND6]
MSEKPACSLAGPGSLNKSNLRLLDEIAASAVAQAI